jgi:hypothetical protein
VPPKTLALKVADWPELIELGLTEQVAVKLVVTWLTLTEQAVDTDCDPEVTVKFAVWVPGL